MANSLRLPRWWRWASIRDTELSIPLHLRVLHGRDHHHITEAQYKALARALRAAVEPDPRLGGIPSTKGAL